MKKTIPYDFFELNPIMFILNIVWVYGLIMFGWYICGKYNYFYLWLIFYIFTGVLQNGLSNLLHDAYHYRISSNNFVNEFFARWLLASPLTIPLSSGRNSHLTHHKLVGLKEDPDIIYYGNSDKCSLSSLVWFYLKLFSGIQYLIVGLKVLGIGKKSNVRVGGKNRSILDVVAIVITQASLLFLSVYFYSDIYHYVFLWLLPLATILVGLNSFRSYCEHVEYEKDNWSESKTRLYTTKSNPIERFIIAPFNMNYHAEHHLAVGVPFYKLPSFRAWLEENNMNDFGYRESYINTALRYIKSLPIR